MNWNDLHNFNQPTWLERSELFALLIASENLLLSGWAKEGDPLIKKANELYEQQDQDTSFFEPPSVIGGLSLNGCSFVFWCDPDDGYRSYLSNILMIPNQKFATTFSPVPIQAVITEDAQQWGDPTNPTLLSLMSTDINKIVAQVGTDYDDSYYPSCVFYLDTETLDEAMPLAIHRTLKNVVGGLGVNSVRKI